MANTDVGVTISTKINQAVSSVKSLNSELDKVQTRIKALGNNSNLLGSSVSKINSSKIKTLNNDVKKTDSSFSSLSNSIKKATNGLNKGFDLGKMYFLYNRMLPIARGISKTLESAVDYTETVNLFANSMGEMTDRAMEFQDKISEAFGTAQTTMMNYQATYKNMLSALSGLSDEASEKISETLTLMSIDYASLYNVEMEDSAKKFQSALSRQVRPIRSTSGYDITQNVLGDYLNQMGIYDRAVSDLSEMEKRLLIIYSLQQQMANSNAFGDFARTIESPANQLRVLQEQIIETGRWIGSVFYGVLGKVLPYINGFVMAVKEAVKWVALLFGYEVEDYTSNGGTYFDQAFGDSGDVLDEATSGVDGVNDSLDDTAKKAKEVKESLSSLDELNVITSSSDKSSGSGSGSTGLSSGIDPRILDSLGQYEDMLDKIRMKANDVRDSLTEWGKVVGVYVNENIFKPISTSWDKYGESILSRAQSTLSNIGYLFDDAFSITLTRLPELVSSASSLLFSLVDDVAIICDGIGKLFKELWDKGGNVLYEQLLRLVSAIMDLGTVINDSFVKPILKAFSDYVAPVVGDVLGVLLRLLGSLVGIIADVTKAISNNKIAVGAVCTVLTTLISLYTTSKIAKSVRSWVDVIKMYKKEGLTVFNVIKDSLLDSNKLYLKVKNTAKDFFGETKSGGEVVKKAFEKMTSSNNVFSKALSTVSSYSSKLFTSLKNGVNSLLNGLGGLSGVLSSLTPTVGLATAGFVALSGVAMYLLKDYEGLSGASKELNDSLKEQQKEMDKTTSSIKKSQQATKEKIEESQKEVSLAKVRLSQLNEMVDSEGNILVSQEKVSYVVDKLNSQLGTNITIQDGVIQNWKEEKLALEDTIEAMKRKAIVEAHEEEFIEATKREAELSEQLSVAKRKLADCEDELFDKKKRLQELTKKGSSMTAKEVEEYKNLGKEISDLTITHNQLEKNVESAQLAFDTNQKSINDYSLALDSLDGSIENTAKSLVAQYEVMGKKSTATWSSMAKGLVDLTAKHNQYVKDGTDLNSKEVLANKEATKQIIQHMVEKANTYDLTYNQMVKKLESTGIKLSTEEKKMLKEQYNDFAKNKSDILAIEASKWDSMTSQTSIKMSNLKDAQKQKLDEYLVMFQQNGDKTGFNYCQKLANALKGSNGRVTSEVSSIISQIEAQASRANPNVKVKSSVDWSSLNGVVSAISTTVGSVWSTIKLSLPKFATGGFPEDGVFMANHNELVGKFSNGKTAVANNNQIVEGIKQGVTQAMKEANATSKQDTHVSVYIGKKKIIDEIKNADKEEAMKTGKVRFST